MKIVLLVVGSLRADAPGFGGGPATPTLDQLAAEGTRFERTYASASWTVPSLMALTTGCWPWRVGVCRWRHPVSPVLPSLPAAFAAAGFDVRVVAPEPRFALRSLPGVSVVRDSQDPAAVQDALRAPRGSDRLIVLHHGWTQLPYLQAALPKRGWKRAGRAAVDALAADPAGFGPRLQELYLRAVAGLDGELLPRWLDAAWAGGDEVVVAVTGDHGESWGEEVPPGRPVEHAFDLHGRWMSDATTRVPLLIHAPGRVPAGQALGGFVRGVDVAPTLAGLAGVPLGRCDGTSLGPAMAAGLPAPSDRAWTVATHNVFHPDTYPSDGRAVFRRFAERSHGGRVVHDFVDGTTRTEALDGALVAPSADAARARLQALWLDARDPGPLRPLEENAHAEGHPHDPRALARPD